jgi:hypothetical protein
VGEMETLQSLLGCGLPEAMARMYSVDDVRLYLWRAWVAARRNGHPDATLDDLRQVPLLSMLEATATAEVTDAKS